MKMETVVAQIQEAIRQGLNETLPVQRGGVWKNESGETGIEFVGRKFVVRIVEVDEDQQAEVMAAYNRGVEAGKLDSGFDCPYAPGESAMAFSKGWMQSRDAKAAAATAKPKGIVLTPTEKEAILKEWHYYSGLTKSDLKEIYRQSHKVCDLNGVDKQSLVTGIMHAKHGEQRIAQAFGIK